MKACPKIDCGDHGHTMRPDCDLGLCPCNGCEAPSFANYWTGPKTPELHPVSVSTVTAEALRLAPRGYLEALRENKAKLDGCQLHDFQGIGRPIQTPSCEYHSWYECTKCGGRVYHSIFDWYSRGINHGKAVGE